MNKNRDRFKSVHPLVRTLMENGELNLDEAREVMRSNARHPRGIGGLSKAERIKWVQEKNCWILGPNA